MSADPGSERMICVHCGQLGVTAETVACPETRTTYKIGLGFGDWPGNHIMRRLDAPPDGPTWVTISLDEVNELNRCERRPARGLSATSGPP